MTNKQNLNHWWQVVVVSYWENPSILKFAKFFGVTSYTARMVIKEIESLRSLSSILNLSHL